MCGIFGIISDKNINTTILNDMAIYARQRGRDSSGLFYNSSDIYHVKRADYDIKQLLRKQKNLSTNFIMGHSRLVTNGLSDNQPVIRDGLVLIHNGIVVNDHQVWKKLKIDRQLKIDSEVILAVALQYLSDGCEFEDLPRKILDTCDGTISAAVANPKNGKLILFSNNGSLYVGKTNETIYFSSERFPLQELQCDVIEQVIHDGVVLKIPIRESIQVFSDQTRKQDLIPAFKNIASEEAMLVYPQHELRRCNKCVLPETMPFISFDEEGICNYCRAYQPRNNPKPKKELLDLVAPYRRPNGSDCIVPFSGGRDSCWGLHLIVNELMMKPITYTYDWGMVTDLGRRNISRMCSQLGVENIIVADDISKKRRNIAMNLEAWLKALIWA